MTRRTKKQTSAQRITSLLAPLGHFAGSHTKLLVIATLLAVGMIGSLATFAASSTIKVKIINSNSKSTTVSIGHMRSIGNAGSGCPSNYGRPGFKVVTVSKKSSKTVSVASSTKCKYRLHVQMRTDGHKTAQPVRDPVGASETKVFTITGPEGGGGDTSGLSVPLCRQAIVINNNGYGFTPQFASRCKTFLRQEGVSLTKIHKSDLDKDKCAAALKNPSGYTAAFRKACKGSVSSSGGSIQVHVAKNRFANEGLKGAKIVVWTSASGSCKGDNYKTTDSSGIIEYTNCPTEGKYSAQVRELPKGWVLQGKCHKDFKVTKNKPRAKVQFKVKKASGNQKICKSAPESGDPQPEPPRDESPSNPPSNDNPGNPPRDDNPSNPPPRGSNPAPRDPRPGRPAPKPPKVGKAPKHINKPLVSITQLTSNTVKVDAFAARLDKKSKGNLTKISVQVDKQKTVTKTYKSVGTARNQVFKIANISDGKAHTIKVTATSKNNKKATATIKIRGFVPPADEDKDGVPDSKDNCPGTPAGRAVHKTGPEAGCEIPDPETGALEAIADFKILETKPDPDGKPETEVKEPEGNPTVSFVIKPLTAPANQQVRVNDSETKTPIKGQIVVPGGADDIARVEGLLPGNYQVTEQPSDNFKPKDNATAKTVTVKVNDTARADFENVIQRTIIVDPVCALNPNAPQCKDDDKDGVTNDKDKCPNTPAGSTVNAEGCSTNDDDKDGVPNDKDKCPNTPEGVAVNAEGCDNSSSTGVVTCRAGFHPSNGDGKFTDPNNKPTCVADTQTNRENENEPNTGGLANTTNSLGPLEPVSKALGISSLPKTGQAGILAFLTFLIVTGSYYGIRHYRTRKA